MESMDISDSSEENNTSEENIVNHQLRRIRYRNLLDKVEEIKESGDTGLQTAEYISSIYNEIDELNSQCDIKERVKNANEILLEAKTLSSASEVLIKSIKAIDTLSSTYEPKDFTTKLKTIIARDNNNSDFGVLKKYAKNIIPDKLKHDYLYGAYDLDSAPQLPQRKTREKTIQENLTKKQPEKVEESANDEKSIGEIVNFLYDVLNDEYKKQQCNYINYYDYIINTDDYGKTIENMFYFAFLVREGRAAITLENNVPCIKPMLGGKSEAVKDANLKNSQIVASITMKDWMHIKKPGYLQLRKGVMKSRNKGSAGRASKSTGVQK